MGEKMKSRVGIVGELEISVTEDGEVISLRNARMHSFVNNMGAFILRGMDTLANTDCKTVANVAISAAAVNNWSRYYGNNSGTGAAGMNTIGAAGDTTKGIVVGTSNAAFGISQYNLQALIPHGGGASQLSYAAMATPAEPVFSTPNILLEISRDFANNSGAAVTVREIGLKGYIRYGWQYYDTYLFAEVLFARDVVSDTVVNNAQVLNVKYIFKTVI